MISIFNYSSHLSHNLLNLLLIPNLYCYTKRVFLHNNLNLKLENACKFIKSYAKREE